MIVEGEVRTLRSSLQGWVLLGDDTNAAGRVLIRGTMAGAEKTLSVSRAVWDDPRLWRHHAAADDGPSS